MSLDKIRSTLVNKWSAAHFRYHLLGEAERQVVKILYSTSDIYDFYEYSRNNTWLSDDALLPEPPGDSLYYEYGYNSDNTPVLVKKHYTNSVSHMAVFIWNEVEWEYLEYNTASQTCSNYCSITLEAGIKKILMSLRLNGGGQLPVFNDETSVTEMAALLIQDPYIYFITIEQYNYESNVLTSANTLSYSPGIGKYYTTNRYAYNEKGDLQSITAHYTNGDKQLQYIAITDRPISVLIETVANQLAEYILYCISMSDYREKLSCIQLTYQYGYNFWPGISPLSEKITEWAIRDEDIIFPSGDSYVFDESETGASRELQENFAEMEQVMKQKHDWNIGLAMLKKTARILMDSKLEKLIPTTKQFVVFPIDWSLSESPTKTLLMECGVNESKIKFWNKLGWLD